MQVLSLHGGDRVLTVTVSFTRAPSISIYRNHACMKARSGLDWEVSGEAVNLSSFGWQLVWLTCSLTDLSLCFELITKLCVCMCATVLRWGEKEKNDNDEGAGDVTEKSGFGGWIGKLFQTLDRRCALTQGWMGSSENRVKNKKINK